MIVCQCNRIRLADIEGAIRALLSSDPHRLIVPVQVYRRLSQRGKCCGCFPGVVDIIARVTAEFHEEMQTPRGDIIDLVERLKRHQETLILENRRFHPSAEG